jgi:hypothetical protein
MIKHKIRTILVSADLNAFFEFIDLSILNLIF